MTFSKDRRVPALVEKNERDTCMHAFTVMIDQRFDRCSDSIAVWVCALVQRLYRCVYIGSDRIAV